MLSFLVLLAIIAIIIVVVAISVSNSWGKMRKQAEKDTIEHSSVCDTISYITERPDIWFYEFKEDEINELTFHILRNDELIGDTVIRYPSVSDRNYSWKEIPYDCFLKTDTIVVMTKDSLYFYISDYHHYANLHYGMFGYLGHSDCRLSKNCVINGVPYSYASLNKSEGLKKSLTH